jgi:hypothetical protein
VHSFVSRLPHFTAAIVSYLFIYYYLSLFIIIYNIYYLFVCLFIYSSIYLFTIIKYYETCLLPAQLHSFTHLRAQLVLLFNTSRGGSTPPAAQRGVFCHCLTAHPSGSSSSSSLIPTHINVATIQISYTSNNRQIERPRPISLRAPCLKQWNENLMEEGYEGHR